MRHNELRKRKITIKWSNTSIFLCGWGCNIFIFYHLANRMLTLWVLNQNWALAPRKTATSNRGVLSTLPLYISLVNNRQSKLDLGSKATGLQQKKRSHVVVLVPRWLLATKEESAESEPIICIKP
jgi:hypothetical protein